MDSFHTMTRTFTKEVPRDAVEEVFFIAPYATYQNETFGVSDASNHRVLLTTSEKEKADKYHFQRTDKYLYEKHRVKRRSEVNGEKNSLFIRRHNKRGCTRISLLFNQFS